MKISRFFLSISLISLFFLSGILHHDAHAQTSAQNLTIRHWVDPSDERNVSNSGFGSPTYITFNPKVFSPQLSAYGPDKKFWKTYHEGYLVYSPIPPSHMVKNQSDLDLSVLIENRERTNYYSFIWKTPFVDMSRTLHLKKGSHSVSDWSEKGYRGDNTGTTLINGTVFGMNIQNRNYEWRYLGYTIDGKPFGNPLFPPDYPSDRNPNDRDYYDFPWERFADADAQKTDFDDSKEKLEWLKTYFFKDRKEWWLPRNKGETDAQLIDRTARAYLNRFSIKGDPTLSSVPLVAFHRYKGNDHYIITSTIAPPQPNLRMVEFQIVDAETNKVLGTMKRNALDNKNKNTYLSFDKEPFLTIGKEYKLRAIVKNMRIDNMAPKNTTYNPLGIDLKVAYDEKVNRMNDWDEEHFSIKSNPLSGRPWTSRQTQIPYNDALTFDKNALGEEWLFKVPDDGLVQKEIKFRVEIPVGFYYAGENTETTDDFAELVLPIERNDIGTSRTAELIDSEGNSVTEVEPGKSYGLRFTIFKDKGEQPVGDSKNLTKNPFASLSVSVSDGNKTYNYNLHTDKTMYRGDRIVLEQKNAIVPEKNFIEAKWQIRQIHRDLEQSTIHNNDGPFSQSWRSDINISVNNFKVGPQVVYRPLGQSAGSQDISVSAKIMNSNPTNQTKDIDIILRQGGRQWKYVRSIPANQTYDFHANLGSIPLNYGNIPFEIEVNYPNPIRKWPEARLDGSNPYIDNIAYQSILVGQNKVQSYCDTTHTRNEWRTTYTLTEYYHYLATRYAWYISGYDKEGNPLWSSYSYKEPDSYVSSRWTETRNHFEAYQITNVLFKSKLTEDTQGGWIELVNGEKGKVKAGYGFDIKYVVRYQTDVTNIPVSRSFSGFYPSYSLTVSPQTSPVNPPNVLHVEMPYTDSFGQKVRYDLIGSNSGPWTSRVISYEMPKRSAFGKEDNRKVYVNETARDQTYSIRLDTEPFYGTFDKPPVGLNLCDVKHVNIEIVGANSDDVKSHITQ